MTGTTLKVYASIQFLTIEEGGRVSAVRGTYRPLHNFADPTNRELWFGQIVLEDDASIEPGERRDLVVEFPSDDVLAREFVPGRSWRIQEGAQLVAKATVLKILDET